MTAAKVMDIISRVPWCAGQAADAVSAYTQVKMEDDPKLLKIPKSECPDIWIRLPRHKWPKSWSSMEDPVVPLERNLYGHPLAGLLWERQFEKILLQHGCEKVSNWECLFVHRQQGLLLSVYVDDIRNQPMKLRSDFSEALTKLHRLHRESGEERLAPIPSWQYQKWHPSSSSSSTSWWQWCDSWWSS